MRVLAVADYLGLSNPSGAGRYVLETGRALMALGHEVRILAGGEAGDPPTAGADGYPPIARFPFPASGGRVRWLASGGWAGIGASCRRLAAGWRPTRLLLNQPLSGAAALRALPDVPAAYVFHSGWGAEREAMGGGALGRWPRERLERRVLARCARAVTLSDYMAGELARIHPGLALPLRRIPGGADPVRFAYAPDPRAARAALGLPRDRPVLLTVRRLVPRMGLEALVAAVGLVARGDPLLLVAGRGPLEATLRRAPAERVRLLGFVPEPELPRLMGAADLFVLPSQSLEGFGMVIAEAMACGTPVLGTPVGAIPEVLGAFDRSLVAVSPSAEGLAGGISALLAAPDRLAALRPLCRTHAERHFRWERAGTALASWLEAGA